MITCELKGLVNNVSAGYGKEENEEVYNIPVAKVSNVNAEGNFHRDFEVRSFTAKEKDRLLAKNNDLFVVKSSGSKSNILSGKTALYCKDVFPELIASNFLIRLSPILEKVSPKYLWYYLNSQHSKNYIKTIVGATTYPNLKWNLYGKLPVPVVPLAQQKKIAAILDAADACRQKTKALIEKYDELTQSLFLDMFGDPVTNPKGWKTKTVEQVCSKIYGGGTPSKSKLEYYEGDIPWVTPKDMKFDYIQDSIDHINQLAVDNSSAKLIPKGSVLMVIRSGILKHSLPVAINTKVVTVNQDMKAYIPETSITNSVFLKSFFDAVSSYLLSKVRAVTADNIEFKQIKELSFICPSIELQNQFSNRVQAIEAQKAQAQTSLAQAEDLFNSLLQRAFKGELTS